MPDVIRVGGLLVATPLLEDPNFRRSVVLIVEHDGSGSTLGVVLNRPTEIEVTQVLPTWGGVVTGPSVVFQGGPVQLDSALGLASVRGDREEPLGWRRLLGPPFRLGAVDLDAPPEVLAAEIVSMRVFAGYSGWSAGQLDSEIREGAWYVVDALPEDAFSGDPSRLWRDVLRRQGGELAFVANCPDDPTLN
ncbi:YqgE/AlgH family protein [Bailinhaonella thermotolerans]|uniref:UPF0301 protein D5H75_29945 n=1 Tax=Bailinhaonella thermotolerans TaxID=1070861 RepID=A0A3A4ACQ6_9ACTN|nr:YqgE/AlgH family protein [Bailinhaonella thermotolerans]RJL24537.1 YqgE/AlgH family protein [Bailinhaonella thermotolerans]